MLSSIGTFFVLNKFKIFGYVAIIAIVGGSIFAAYRYVENLNDSVTQQAVTIARQEVALETVENTLNRTLDNYEIMNRNLDELEVSTRAANAGIRELRQLFSDHDLTNLAAEKPGLIENRINNGTDEILNDLRELTTP